MQIFIPEFRSCPACGAVWGVDCPSTGLGREWRICPRCRRKVRTGKTEWEHMGPLKATWFCVMALLYTVFPAIIIAGMLQGLRLIWLTGRSRYASEEIYDDPVFVVLLVLASAACFAVHAWRVMLSVRRTAAEDEHRDDEEFPAYVMDEQLHVVFTAIFIGSLVLAGLLLLIA